MKKLLLFCAIFGLITACKKEDPEPEKPVITGTLKGRVIRYDQFGAAYTDNPGVTVNISGKGLSTVTDQQGNYAFYDMSSGTYTLTFQKNGCGAGILQDLRYKFTDTSNFNVSMADIPTFGITNAYVKDTTWFSGSLSGIYYNANTQPSNNKATLVAIVGKKPGMTIDDPLSYVNFGTTSLINTQDYGRFLSYQFLSQSLKFKKDSVIYVKIYPVSAVGASYIDNQLNRPIYTAFGTAFPTTFTFTMPI